MFTSSPQRIIQSPLKTYRDTHNIGRRTSTSNVVTYSMDSNLFFDVYVKFDPDDDLMYKIAKKGARRAERRAASRMLPTSSLKTESSVPLSIVESSVINSSNTETFQRILDNKTIFKTRMSEVVSSSSIKTEPEEEADDDIKLVLVRDIEEDEQPAPVEVAKKARKQSVNKSKKVNVKEKLIQSEKATKKSISKEKEKLIQSVKTTKKSISKEKLIQSVKTTKKSISKEKEILIQSDKITKKSVFKEIKDVKKEVCNESVIETVKRKRGRPRKEEVVKRKRGRPRKIDKVKKEAEGELESQWRWHGDGIDRAVRLKAGEAAVIRKCFEAVRHAGYDLEVREGDSVLMRSGDGGLPFVAMVTALFWEPSVGRKMAAVLWYYRPEHTAQGRQQWHSDADLYSSLHQDTNPVDCIEDRALVLPEAANGVRESLRTRTAASSLPPENVFVCRGLYDVPMETEVSTSNDHSRSSSLSSTGSEPWRLPYQHRRHLLT